MGLALGALVNCKSRDPQTKKQKIAIGQTVRGSAMQKAAVSKARSDDVKAPFNDFVHRDVPNIVTVETMVFCFDVPGETCMARSRAEA